MGWIIDVVGNDMEIIANIFGITATIVFLSSYQFKSRKQIIICSTIARLLYALQYVFLGAFSGLVLDLVAGFVSIVAEKKDCDFIKKRFPLVVVLCYVLILASGAIAYEGIFTIIAVLGVIFEVTAFWVSSVLKIRLLSLLAPPCWGAYNIKHMAYGAAVGNVITFVSIIVSIFRYHVFKKDKKTEK